MCSDWKVYTKTGDKGETALIGGNRVPKYHCRINAYGTLDELNSYIGLIRDTINSNNDNYISTLIKVQKQLFIIESQLATDSKTTITKSLPLIQEEDISFLEKEIDIMNENIPTLTSFILPGGNKIGSHCHIARCICRRAERIIVQVAEDFEIDPLCIKYINRLSDYLFVLARKITYEFGGEEIPWKPKT